MSRIRFAAVFWCAEGNKFFTEKNKRIGQPDYKRGISDFWCAEGISDFWCAEGNHFFTQKNKRIGKYVGGISDLAVLFSMGVAGHLSNLNKGYRQR